MVLNHFDILRRVKEKGINMAEWSDVMKVWLVNWKQLGKKVVNTQDFFSREGRFIKEKAIHLFL